MPDVDVVEIAIRLRCVVWKDDEAWISHCPSLDVYSQGNSQDDAQKSIEEAAKLWVMSCLERDKLSEALAEVGWRKFGPEEEIPDHQDSIHLRQYSIEDTSGGDSERIEFPIKILVPAYQANLFNEHRAG